MGAAVQRLAVRRAFRQGLNEADFFDGQNALAFKLWRCPLLALSGQSSRTSVCPLLDQSGQSRVFVGDYLTANDPKRTLQRGWPMSALG
jgi:hypothetical protein